jgi:hypothetical protein
MMRRPPTTIAIILSPLLSLMFLMSSLQLMSADCTSNKPGPNAEWAVTDFVAYEGTGCTADGCSAPFFSSALGSLSPAFFVSISIVPVTGMRARGFMVSAGAVAVWVQVVGVTAAACAAVGRLR